MDLKEHPSEGTRRPPSSGKAWHSIWPDSAGRPTTLSHWKIKEKPIRVGREETYLLATTLETMTPRGVATQINPRVAPLGRKARAAGGSGR